MDNSSRGLQKPSEYRTLMGSGAKTDLAVHLTIFWNYSHQVFGIQMVTVCNWIILAFLGVGEKS